MRRVCVCVTQTLLDYLYNIIPKVMSILVKCISSDDFIHATDPMTASWIWCSVYLRRRVQNENTWNETNTKKNKQICYIQIANEYSYTMYHEYHVFFCVVVAVVDIQCEIYTQWYSNLAAVVCNVFNKHLFGDASTLFPYLYAKMLKK